MELYSPIICIVGPTACKKSDTAVTLCERLSGEVVSADSVQIYRGMDIGSAKPTMAERRGIPHHLIDCVDIDTPDFSVSTYRQLATEAIYGITAKGKQPVVVGGSGLYVHALTSPLHFAAPKDAAIRMQLEANYDESKGDVFQRLKAVDPASAERLHINDKKRIVRALEVYLTGGKALTAYGYDFQNERGGAAPFQSIKIGLTMERTCLYDRIHLRIERMIKTGLIDEAAAIYKKKYDRNLPAMQSIGYRQLFACFDGACTMDEAVDSIDLDTRHFAKRQLTWFRRDKEILWFDAMLPENTLINEIERTVLERMNHA